MSADELLMFAAVSGRVVCSGDLTSLQIAEAQASGCWYVNDKGFGFTVLPWSLTTQKDKMREAGIWSKGSGVPCPTCHGRGDIETDNKGGILVVPCPTCSARDATAEPPA